MSGCGLMLLISISNLFSCGGRESNPRSLGYEPNEIPLLHPRDYDANIRFLKRKKR